MLIFWTDGKWAPILNANVPGFARVFRFLLFLGAEYDWRLFGSEGYHEKERKKLEDQLLRHMKKTVPKKYHEILTPSKTKSTDIMPTYSFAYFSE